MPRQVLRLGLELVPGPIRRPALRRLRPLHMIALLTARQYTQQYEWDGNYPMSIKNGLSPAIADAIGGG